MRGDPVGADALGQTVGTGCLVGGTFGTLTLILVLLGSLSGIGLGDCNFTLNVIPSAPVRDGLGIAVSADGNKVAVVDSGSGLLDVITGGQFRSQVVVGGQTTDVTLSSDGRTALVTDSEVGNSSGVLAVIDLSTETVTAKVTVGSGPSGVVVSPDGRLAYVADTGYLGSGNVDVVDLTRDTVVGSVTVGSQPAGLAISADGRRLYVANANLYLPIPVPSTPNLPGYVDVVDTASLRDLVRVPVGVAPLFSSLSPDGKTLAVDDYGSNDVTLIDTATLLTRTVPVALGAFGVAFSPDGTNLYVCDGYSPLVENAPGREQINHVSTDAVSVIDLASGVVAGSIKVNHNPTAVVVARNGTAYVALGDFPAVEEIVPPDQHIIEIGVPGLAPLDAPAERGHR